MSSVETRSVPVTVAAQVDSATGTARPFAWATWRLALNLLIVVTALRLIHSIWLSPWDLVGDEAYYWIQAKHPELGYTEKGPLLAWLIAGCCRLFGDVEWAVRLPVLVAGSLGAWGVGRMAMAVSRGDQRVGFLAVAIFLLLPAFQANAMICTQDGLLITLWVALTAVSLRIFRRWASGRGVWGEWLLLWALIGVGILLKHSVLTFLPGLAICWFVRRRELPLRPVFFAQQAAGLVVMVAVVSPLLIWNAQNDWPMIAHTLGHLGAGGDQAGKVNAGNPLTWELNTVGSFVGIFGPAVVLMVWSGVWAWRRRALDPDAWNDQLLLICSAWFTTLFIVALSLTKPIVPSWPLPNMPPAVVLVAQMLVAEWGAAPTRVWTPRRRLRSLAWVTGIYGACSALVLAFPMGFWYFPFFQDKIRTKILGRISGHRERFEPVRRILATVQTPDGRPPLVVLTNYQAASLATFYLPGHAQVTTSGNIVHVRPSNFDRWPETNLRDPSQRGRTLVLINGKNDPKWERAFDVERFEPASEPGYLIARDFRGVLLPYPPPKEEPDEP